MGADPHARLNGEAIDHVGQHMPTGSQRATPISRRPPRTRALTCSTSARTMRANGPMKARPAPHHLAHPHAEHRHEGHGHDQPGSASRPSTTRISAHSAPAAAGPRQAQRPPPADRWPPSRSPPPAPVRPIHQPRKQVLPEGIGASASGWALGGCSQTKFCHRGCGTAPPRARAWRPSERRRWRCPPATNAASRTCATAAQGRGAARRGADDAGKREIPAAQGSSPAQPRVQH